MKRSAPPVIFTDDCWIFTAQAGVTAADLKAKVVDGYAGTGGAPLQKDFIDPQTCVHVTTGNGGPPGKDTFVEDCPGPDCGRIPATRAQTNAFGYSRLVAHNATHLTHEYRFNANSSVFDTFTLVANRHGPFPHGDRK